MKKKLKKGYWFIGCYLFRIFPLNSKKIVFESFLGRTYSDNPKAIYEYMNSSPKYSEYKLYWTFNDPKIYPDVKGVKRIRIRYLYHLYTSKYIINNSRMPLLFKKRKGQIYVQTWHGTPLKKLVFDMDNVLLPNNNSEKYKQNFLKDVKDWDYLVSPNKYSTEIFKRAFRYTGKVLETGYPRTDELFRYDNSSTDKIKNKLGINQDKIVVLYSPTFRDDEFVKAGHYIQKILINFEKMKKNHPNVIFLIRTHYLVKELIIEFPNADNYLDVSDYNNINDLFWISNILITDYSSVFFEYALLKKTIIFYQYDYEKYKDVLRGFYLDRSELPGEIVYKEEALYKLLEAYILEYENSDKIEANDYIIYPNEFAKKFINSEQKNSSQAVVEKILKE